MRQREIVRQRKTERVRQREIEKERKRERVKIESKN